MLLAVVAVLFLHPFPASLSDSSPNFPPPALLRRFCSDGRANDPQEFDVNFVDTMETVARQVSDAGFGFATSGNGTSDQVYGMGQCFGYLSPIDCRLCYAESRVKLPACLPVDSARVFLEGCFLAYAGHNFSSQPVDQFDDSLCGAANVSGDAGSFGSAVSGLIWNLTSEASGRSNYYVVGSGKASSKVEIFGMAQCWRSLNATGCRTCLEDGRRRAIGCLPATDGRALNAGCYVRYSTQSFYETPLHSSGKSSGNYTS